jgi:hypothetical protein
MLQKNIAHVLYAIENIELSSMPKTVIFHVFYAISIILTIKGIDAISGPSMGPTRQWEREKSPSSSPEISKFDTQFDNLAIFDTQFATSSKFDTQVTNSFKKRDSPPILYHFPSICHYSLM